MPGPSEGVSIALCAALHKGCEELSGHIVGVEVTLGFFSGNVSARSSRQGQRVATLVAQGLMHVGSRNFTFTLWTFSEPSLVKNM